MKERTSLEEAVEKELGLVVEKARTTNASADEIVRSAMVVLKGHLRSITVVGQHVEDALGTKLARAGRGLGWGS